MMRFELTSEGVVEDTIRYRGSSTSIRSAITPSPALLLTLVKNHPIWTEPRISHRSSTLAPRILQVVGASEMESGSISNLFVHWHQHSLAVRKSSSKEENSKFSIVVFFPSVKNGQLV
jgi:hypothetical protein